MQRTSVRDPDVELDDEEDVVPREGRFVDTRSLDFVWRSGVAGGLAGCAVGFFSPPTWKIHCQELTSDVQAKTVVAPLDRVKILFQANNPQFTKYTGSWFGVSVAMKDIYRQEGLAGLYRGHSATLLRIFPYAGIKFLAYEQIRSIFIRNKEQETPLRRLLSGSLAGVTSVFFTYPLEVIRVRLAFETRRDHRSSLREICAKIYHEQPYSRLVAAGTSSSTIIPSAAPQVMHNAAAAAAQAVEAVAPRSGLVNFYRGFSPTLLGMLPYAGMSFLTHDTAGDLLRHPSIAKYTTLPKKEGSPADKPAPLCSWAELLAGGVAGLVSQTASYPLEVVRRRMQVGGAVGDGHRLRIAETAGLILREKGLKGFFVGLTIGYVKVIPMVAVSFYTYERMKTYFGI
jgi:solute carrier family 25 (mitochondrial carrier protein), member 16